MATKILGKTYEYGILKQTNWATPQAGTANYKTIPYDAGVSIFDPGVRVELFNTSGQSGIHKEFERVYVDGRSGLSSATFSMPGDVKTITPHIAGSFLSVAENASSPFIKTYTVPGLTAAVDFNGDDAPLHTICCKETAGATNDGIVLENAIIDNITFSWDFIANGIARLLRIQGKWVGNEMNFEQNTSGTWTTTTFAPMNSTDTYTLGTLDVDGVDWSGETIRRFEFTVNNNVTTNASTTIGKPNNYDITPVYSAKIFLDYNTVTELVLKDFQDGAQVDATIASSISVGTDGNFSISAVNGIMQRQAFEYNGDFAAVVLDVMFHSANAASPVTGGITDTVDWGY